MKRLFLLILLLAFIQTSCNNEHLVPVFPECDNLIELASILNKEKDSRTYKSLANNVTHLIKMLKKVRKGRNHQEGL